MAKDPVILDQKDLTDWQAALDVLIAEHGEAYSNHLLSTIGGYSSYWNTPLETETIDVDLVNQCSALVRWNAAQIVLYSGQFGSEIGGHLSTFASSALLYEVGMDYFFKGDSDQLGDLVFYQGHASPGLYARSYLLGQLSLDQIQHFRRESNGKGISSYPHPWLMPDYWQFPTVSMGLGPIKGIYQARMIKYLESRELLSQSSRKVWVFCGDGEMDEVESLGALGVASREQLNNLIFVVNCNLVRLDGPCRGNGQIIEELSRYFNGAGWEVIKLVWSQAWIRLVDNDQSGYLKSKLSRLLDGELQALMADQKNMKAWLQSDPKTSPFVEGWSDQQFSELVPGGHDAQLIANAYSAASKSARPCVILVLSEKGYGLTGVSGQNSAHNQKKLTDEQQSQYLEFLQLDHEVQINQFYKPNEDNRISFMQTQRQQLGGLIPRRRQLSRQLNIPDLSYFSDILTMDQDRELSTTMAFVRIINFLLRHEGISKYVVPIIADEGRTMGMEGLFRQIGIYQPNGQQYTPVDRHTVSYYKEDAQGQLLQEGINEAGATASWIAAATSYSVNDCPLISIYAFYSMFGFQRVGDLIYSAADSRARGFLIGATSGRTTLGGEGLQHNDGTSQLIASTIPNCKSYDPCFAYELAVIMQHGLKDMYVDQKDVFYYITIMNENYTHPHIPADCEQDIIKGMYCLQEVEHPTVDLLASGAILREAMHAGMILRDKHHIAVRVWSVTSWSELQREYIAAKHEHRVSYVEQCIGESTQVVFGMSDYVSALPGLIHEAVGRPYYTLGTDGFGMSDTREALRDYYGVSSEKIIESVLRALIDVGLHDDNIKQSNGCNTLTDDRRQV